MTTVAFVTYYYRDQLRRVGPMTYEPAESFARELQTKPDIDRIRLEKWMCVDSQEFGKKA